MSTDTSAPATVDRSGSATVPLRAAAVRGAIAGLVGGFVYGAGLAQSQLLPEIARMVGGHTDAAGYAAHLVVAVVLGAVFGVLMRARRDEPGELLFWGLAYGMFWWYLGMLTLFPLWAGTPLGWSIDAARTAFPYLIGHLLYGACVAVVLAALQSPRTGSGAALIRGAVAGALAALVLPAVIDPFPAIIGGRGSLVLLGSAAGVAFALLHPRVSTTGPAIARGVGLGFLVWITVPVTVVPLLRDGRLLWSVDAARDLFPTLVACLVLGAAVGALSSWLSGVTRLLLADPAERADDDSLGARTLRAVVRGAAGGIAGGLIFTVVMVQIGYLGTVARLVGSTSPGVGLAVHLVISVILGSTYGLFFRRRSGDLASGIGWGVSWGFLWWIVGALTVLPVWLGGGPQWSATAAASAFPSLIGHLGFGAALGATYQALEARYDPWWTRRAMPTSAQERALEQTRRAAAAAPAVWALNALIAITVTVLLGL
jgi:uncharacterized membrane protein YagU involved in acid resistance